MIIGLGIDIVPVARIARLLERRGARFLARYFAPEEATADAGAERIAGRWAAKEAAAKALGSGFADGVRPCDIVVLSGADGAPRLELRGAAAQRAQRLGAVRSALSISHAGGLALAVVVLEGGAA
ncbi:MAG: holo-ACP synthase [Planctomycetota bacterium]|nr:holo-ACP synthase [Planctomycetota bacterium]